jgi:tRNA modification GTPase
MHTSEDTIVAIASTVGGRSAARVIARLSGPKAHEFARAVVVGRDLPHPSYASQCRLRLRLCQSDFPAWIYRFDSPRSFTREDMIEFHLPGSTLLARMLVDELIKLGARQADPGEFTARAYFNGRLDLTQAEGIGATIAAQSRAQLEAARRLSSGELSRRLAPIMESVAQTLALVEAGIDFADEGISFLPRDQIESQVSVAKRALKELLAHSSRFETLAHEPQVVLVGRPNAGKSTLLNALAGRRRAVVSRVPGTTRDAIGSRVKLRHGVVSLTDLPGIETEFRSSPGDPIATEMQATAMRTSASADVVVLVKDVSDPRPSVPLDRAPAITVLSKSDLKPAARTAGELAVSAHTGDGMDELLHRLDQLAFRDVTGATDPSAAVALNDRHVRAVRDALDSLDRANALLDSGAELLALELRDTLDHLGDVLGQVTPDDVLGRVFATFCIGK